MQLDLPPVRIGELFAIVDDVEERLVDLSYVMEEGDSLDGPSLPLVEIGAFSEGKTVAGDSPDMGTRFRVIRVDRVEQRFERGAGESLGGSAFAALADKKGAASGAEQERH